MHQANTERRSINSLRVIAVFVIVLAGGGVAYWWWHASIQPAHRVILPPEHAEQFALYNALNRGKRLLTDNQAEAALEIFEQIVIDDPDGPNGREADLCVAHALARIGRVDEARQRYARLDAAQGDEPDARAQLGAAEAYSWAGDHEKAVRELNRVINVFAEVQSDQCAEGLFTLARIHKQIDQSARARAALGRVIAEFPGLEGSNAASAGIEIDRLRVASAAEQETLVNDLKEFEVAAIDGDRPHWDRTTGPYLVTDKVTVPSGSVLTLSPGVTVRFGAEGELVVVGRLEANGTAEQPIDFISIQDDTARGWWPGLRFRSSADGAPSHIEHARIIGAEIGVGCEQGAVELRHVVVRHAVEVGVAVRADGVITATDSTIEDGANEGVQVTHGGALRLERVTVRNQHGPGVSLSVTHSPVSILDSRIERNGRAGLFFRDAVKGTVHGCRILGNRGTGILCRNDASPTLTGNIIQDNQGDGVHCLARCDVVIEINQITDNQGDGIVLDTKSGQTIRGNTIAKNTIGIRCRLGSDPAITGNRILDNRVAGVRLTDSAAPTLTGNILVGNGEAALQNHSPAAIHAENNYWGTADPEQIDRQIEDHADDASRGRVTYTPALSEPTTQPVR
jgi:parallel beta-helix repeat protein